MPAPHGARNPRRGMSRLTRLVTERTGAATAGGASEACGVRSKPRFLVVEASCESRIGLAVVPLEKFSTCGNGRPRNRDPKHDSIFVRRFKATSSNRVAERAHMDAEFGREFLQRPQTIGIFGRNERSCLVRPSIRHRTAPGISGAACLG